MYRVSPLTTFLPWPHVAPKASWIRKLKNITKINLWHWRSKGLCFVCRAKRVERRYLPQECICGNDLWWNYEAGSNPWEPERFN
jgi:hypothetical protein